MPEFDDDCREHNRSIQYLGKACVVELDFRNVRRFHLTGDYPPQIVLDEIALERNEDVIRVVFVGNTGFGVHVDAQALSVRIRDVAPPRC